MGAEPLEYLTASKIVGGSGLPCLAKFLISGSPTWARTRDLRINSPRFDLPGKRLLEPIRILTVAKIFALFRLFLAGLPEGRPCLICQFSRLQSAFPGNRWLSTTLTAQAKSKSTPPATPLAISAPLMKKRA